MKYNKSTKGNGVTEEHTFNKYPNIHVYCVSCFKTKYYFVHRYQNKMKNVTLFF